jgi:hypothetical protein
MIGSAARVPTVAYTPSRSSENAEQHHVRAKVIVVETKIHEPK